MTRTPALSPVPTRRISRRRMVRMRVHTAPERADVSYSLWRILTMRIFVTRTMVRVMERTRRLIQRDAVSRTTMWVHIPMHPGANLRRRTMEMGAPDVIIAAEVPRRQMRTTPARRCVVVTASNRAHSTVRVRSSRFGQSSRTAHPTTDGTMRTSWRI